MRDLRGTLTFRPALLSAVRGYDGRKLVADVTAGAIVGVVAIPLATAFAIASGVPPGAGLATAVVAGFLISAFGGSRVQIGGPTGAFVVIVAGVVQRHGVDGLALATLMAGAMLVVFGLCRLGRIIEFIPDPVIVGFTAGIGIVILVGQVPDVLGLGRLELPGDVPGRLRLLARHVGDANPWAVAVASATVATILLVKRFVPRMPGPVVALVLLTVATTALGLDVETIGDRFGTLPAGLPAPRLPAVTMERLRELFPSALAIALLGAIESLLSAVVADAMIEDRHDSNQELLAQGIANMASPILGGIPATGAIARTATNVQNGGRTPIAGMVHAAVVLVAISFLTGPLSAVPLAVLGGILVVVAYYMSDVPRLLRIADMPRSDAVVLATTLVLTVVVDLVVAVEVGMVLAAFLFMLRMSEVARVEVLAPGEDLEETAGGPRRQQPMEGKVVPAGVVAYSIDGPFFFGAAERFERTIARVQGSPPVVIFRMRHVPYVDATGVAALRSIVQRLQRQGTTVILSALAPDPLRTLRRAGLLELVGETNVCPDIDVALRRARKVLAAD